MCNKLNILIACEESQVVCIAFRSLGYRAFSCDVQPCSGGYPDWHIQDDVLNHIHNSKWDMIIGFPPCTHLSGSGARWFPEKIRDGRQQQAIDFFMEFTKLDCKYVAIENPVGIMSTKYRKPDQYIQPWQFGHEETKKTCLWLKNLPKLHPTNIVFGRENRIHRMPPSENRGKLRSKTYLGVAQAMADQWTKQTIL